jgi:hypothetical protein
MGLGSHIVTNFLGWWKVFTNYKPTPEAKKFYFIILCRVFHLGFALVHRGSNLSNPRGNAFYPTHKIHTCNLPFHIIKNSSDYKSF